MHAHTHTHTHTHAHTQTNTCRHACHKQHAPRKPPSAGREEHHVEAAVHRAMDAYLKGTAWWRRELVPRAMAQDWSWSRSAQAYLDLYRGCL
jgi:hypothetical protein